MHVCVRDGAFAVAPASAASSGTGTPGESPVKENKTLQTSRILHYHANLAAKTNAIYMFFSLIKGVKSDVLLSFTHR